jgi:hypothetical protein
LTEPFLLWTSQLLQLLGDVTPEELPLTGGTGYFSATACVRLGDDPKHEWIRDCLEHLGR